MHLNALLHLGSSDVARDNAVEGRGSARKTLTLKTLACSPVGEDIPVAIRDISPQGFLVEAENDALAKGDCIDINLLDRDSVTARVVWASNRYFGCQLNKLISPGVIAAALVRADAHAAHDAAVPAVTNERFSRQVSDGQLKPGINFAVAFYLSLLCWAVIVLGVYHFVS